MPRVPNISFAASPPASASGVRVSPGALAQAEGAQLELWEGLGDLAGDFGNIALDLKARADETEIMQRERDYGDMIADYQQQQLTNTNPKSWLSEFDARDAAFHASLDSSGLSTKAQQKLKERLSNYRHRTRTRVVRDAGLALVEIGRQELANRIKSYEAAGEHDAGIADLRSIGPSMGLHSSEIEAKALQIQERAKRYNEQQEAEAERSAREADINALSGMLVTDPFAAETALLNGAFGSFDDTDTLRASSQIRTAQNRFRAEISQQMIDGIVSGEASGADLSAMASKARLSPSQEEEITIFRQKRARLEAENGPLDYAAIAKAEAAIEAYDPIQDDTGEGYARLYAQVELATVGGGKAGDSMAGAFRQRLYQKNPFLDHTQEAEAPEGLNKEFTGVLDSYKQSGAFGDQDTEEGQRQWATWNGDLYRRFQAEVKRDPDKFRERGAVEDWVTEQVQGKAFGESIKSDDLPQGDPSVEDALTILGF